MARRHEVHKTRRDISKYDIHHRLFLNLEICMGKRGRASTWRVGVRRKGSVVRIEDDT